MAIRVGIIGTGGISRAHHRAYTAVGGFEIVAVCDILGEKAHEAAEKWVSPKSMYSQTTTRCLKWMRLIR